MKRHNSKPEFLLYKLLHQISLKRFGDTISYAKYSVGMVTKTLWLSWEGSGQGHTIGDHKSRSEVTLKKTYSITPQNVPEVNYPMRVAARDGFEILREETQCTCSDWCCWLYGVFTNKCIRGILFFFFIYFRYTYIGRYLLIIIFFNDPWPIFNTNTIK